MKMKMLAVAALLAASLPSYAATDFGGGPLDLSSGNAIFGRNDAIGTFMDTYTFTLPTVSFLISGTASTAAVGDRDLDFSSIFISKSLSPNTSVATFAGNLSGNENEFYSLLSTMLPAGSYDLIVNGVNSLDRASYAGTLAISATAPVTPVPEPETYALFLAGLGAVGLCVRRKKQA